MPKAITFPTSAAPGRRRGRPPDRGGRGALGRHPPHPASAAGHSTATIAVHLKDESTHPTGSLKHRLARSLFLFGLCNGWLGASTTVIEASSGSTAVSEAYFARLIGLPFIAVMPADFGEKIELICARAADATSSAIRNDLRREPGGSRRVGGHYMDQFTHAERATDWRGNNNIAESIFAQMSLEHHPVPEWIVVGAGTGGTSATIGRFIRYRGHRPQLCVARSGRHSAFYPLAGEVAGARDACSRIEGIGRPGAQNLSLFVPGR